MLAAKEGKTPVIALCQKRQSGFVVVAAPADVKTVMEAWLAAQAGRERLANMMGDDDERSRLCQQDS